MKLCRIDALFTHTRCFQVNAKRTKTGHSHATPQALRAREATDVICHDWHGISWMIELVITGTHKSKPYRHVYYFIISLRTSATALLRLMRQRR